MRIKDIPSLPGYWATEDGRVFGPDSQIRNPTETAKGYLVISCDGIQYRLNRLVCEAFRGPPPTTKHHAAHDDGDKRNNNESNLFWKTPLENAADKHRHGTMPRRATHGRAILSETDVVDIRTRRAKGETLFSIADDYPVSYSTISAVVTGRNWK